MFGCLRLVNLLMFRCFGLASWLVLGLFHLSHGSSIDERVLNHLGLVLSLNVRWLIQVAVSAVRGLIHLIELPVVAWHVEV